MGAQASSHPSVEKFRADCLAPLQSILHYFVGVRDVRSWYLFLGSGELPTNIHHLHSTDPFMQTLSGAEYEVMSGSMMGALPGLVQCFLINPIMSDAFTVEELQVVVQRWLVFLNRLYGPLPADQPTPFEHITPNPLPYALDSRANWEKEMKLAQLSSWPIGDIRKAASKAIARLTRAKEGDKKYTDLLKKMQLVRDLVKGWMTLQQEQVQVPTQVRGRGGDWRYQRKSDATPDYYVFRPYDT